MVETRDRTFFDEAYFQGRSRASPPHERALVYPMAERTAVYLTRTLDPRRVLDLGCAKGYLAEAFHAAGVRTVTGLDVSLYALRHGAAATRGKLVLADARARLPLASGVYDLVTAVDLFEHLADPASVLAEIRRILAPRGRAYLKICHPRHPNASRDPSHVNVQPLAYWTRLFRACGFGWRRIFEADLTLAYGQGRAQAAGQGQGTGTGWIDALKRPVRRFREWAVIGTPADYKFLLWRRDADDA